MNTSTRLILGFTALAAAVSMSTLSSGAAAMAAPSLPPITTLTTPQVSVSVNPASVVLVGSNVTVTTTANWSDGSALDGTISLDVTGPAGTTHLADFSGGTAHAGETFMFAVTSPGDFSYRAHYSPPAGTFGSTATGSAVAHARVSGVPSVALKLGTAVAGSSTPVTATLTLPAGGASYPLGGIVNVQVDALGTLASCTPVRSGSTGASCITSLPGSLSVGTHALTGIFSDSPTYLTGSSASTFTVAAPKPAAPAAGGSSGSGTSSTPSTSGTAASPVPTQAASPTPTATAAPGGGSGSGSDSGSGPASGSGGSVLPASTTASTLPLWIGIAVAILLVAFVVIGVLVTIAVIRTRRARLRPSSTTA